MPDEAQARADIDRLLTAAGWSLQDYKHYNPGAAHGIALREVPLQSGRGNCLLVDRSAVGVIEAKREGTKLSGVADQSAFYADNLPSLRQAKAACVFTPHLPARRSIIVALMIQSPAHIPFLLFKNPKRWRGEDRNQNPRSLLRQFRSS